ncbi:uncharacterized protein FOMMEDRAFT_141116 [Fomitiporia mediterranea MF3/22]|uniref:uncharacterized protein n=1 Tax=Fomitiporia mediterranea (strain MF3/22) TaxID=694068 RepID=UPI000440736A|nr:uncharacterized protein FOMMEDRAFT_141116 [Fomitiporia mediterranea MF3/22]EJD01880.1 hypothetical protein FOMMEDRAFT_141116 [Fomitiporia mediterranea MF3/22]
MADPSEVGKYGTIRLLKRRQSSGVVAAYPIDDEQVTFGRDASCSVRLYYSEVSSHHCRIVFEERKAFIQVLGASGVIVDGCPVYPTKTAVLGNPSSTVTVPLPNGSVFEIHKKRFMFNYPPKALRPQLFTPATVRRKGIRMSLVQSAQVFSPAPSPYPRENLRVLQSPLKIPSSEIPVKLVDGDHPRVYEEGQDLVILEDVEPLQNGHHPGPAMQANPVRLQQLPPARQVPPQTPRRRSAPSLHRAVLIRSAQRTAYMRESEEQMQRQQFNTPGSQFEEINLLEEDAEGDDDDEDGEEDEVENSILNDEANEDMEDVENAQEADMSGVDGAKQKPQVDEQDITEANHEYNESGGEGSGEGPQFITPLQVSRALHLGAFMTPQPGLFSKPSDDEKKERRKTGPQRPPPGFRFSLAPGLGADQTTIKEEDMDEEKANDRPTSPTKRREISEEERKAILERRRSALKAPDPEIGESYKLGEQGSSLVPPPLAPASPFKTLSAHIEEGEDTQVVLQRMQAQVAERRMSLSPTRPRLTRNMGPGMPPLSPQKPFSLLASGPRRGSPIREMPKLEDGIMEETQNRPGKDDSMDVDDSETNKARNEENVDENDENTCPIAPHSRTPRLDGLREMFRGPTKTAGLATPAVRGVRDLFRAPQPMQTPRMEGMRELFAERHAPETPTFDGIGDMMHVDEQDQTKDNNADEITKGKRALENVPGHDAGSSQYPASTRKPSLAVRTLSRGGRARRPELVRTRGTATDASTMADDEASPDSVVDDTSKRLKPNEGVPEAAVVHRGGRGHRTGRVGSDTESLKSSPPRRGRQAKAKANDSEPGRVGGSSPAKAPSKTRGRRKADISETGTESGDTGDAAGHAARRSTRAGSTQPEDAPVTRRSTRARSQSAEPEANDNVEAAVKSADQVGGAAVETILEEEEPVSAHTQTQSECKAAIAPTAPRTRRMRTRTESSADDAPPRKRAGSSTSVVSRRGAKSQISPVESVNEDPAHIEDKENTPERSPVSEVADDATRANAKHTSKGRTPAKAPAKAKASAAGKAKSPTKPSTTTVRAESAVTRSMRTRARK